MTEYFTNCMLMYICFLFLFPTNTRTTLKTVVGERFFVASGNYFRQWR